MKLTRWAMCVASFALLGGVASAEDYIDIQAMQAKLAAQEARLNDLQAKMYGSEGKGDKVVADGLTSLRKNATVTIGGVVASRYDNYSGKIESRYSANDNGLTGADKVGYFVNDGNVNNFPARPGQGDQQPNGYTPPYDRQQGSWAGPEGVAYAGRIGPNGVGERVKIQDRGYSKFDLADAKLEGKIDVNEYFDAYFKFDLQDGGRDRGAGNAQNYWVRWKNVCNTGFGVLIGRDSLKWGGTAPYGRWDDWDKGINDAAMWGDDGGLSGWDAPRGMSTANGMPNRPTIYADSRTMQITPYWENKDGSFKWEVSFFQNPEMYIDGGTSHAVYYDNVYDPTTNTVRNDGVKHLRGMNDGVGSFSSRIVWKPAFVEGLTVRGSVMNLHAKSLGSGTGYYTDNSGIWNYYKGSKWSNENWVETSRNNFATNLGFEYRPCFFNRLNVYASWTHGWNDGWVKDQNSDTVSFGLGIDVIKNLTVYGLVDHVSAKSDQAQAVGDFYKGKGWAHEVGFKYTLPYGVFFDAGWRQETMKYEDAYGDKHTKYSGDGFYGRVGFSF